MGTKLITECSNSLTELEASPNQGIEATLAKFQVIACSAQLW